MIKGNLLKMRVEHRDPVNYFLVIGDSEVNLNDYIGQNISLAFNGQINCIACRLKFRQIFGRANLNNMHLRIRKLPTPDKSLT